MAQALAAIPAAAGSAALGLGKAALGGASTIGKAALALPQAGLDAAKSFGQGVAQTAPMGSNPLAGSNPISAAGFSEAQPLASAGYGARAPIFQPDAQTGLPTSTGATPQFMPSAPIAGVGAPPPQGGFAGGLKDLAAMKMQSGSGQGGQNASAAMMAAQHGTPFAPSLEGTGLTPEQIKLLMQRYGRKSA